ncbi:integrase catalytic domain-containing protein [Trichonephila clavipes]|nr:integrase catalytic domain-containing protein [Trichonephila clavipes]
MQHVIQATVLTGCAKGEDVFIPRISIIPSDNTIQFKRIQFPLKLCFAMTINKSQGQSLGIAGIDLQTPCFSHAQLYVTCSRVGKEENLFVHTPNGTAENVRDLTVGSLVLIKNPASFSTRWTPERIVATHPGADGICQVVTIQTSSGVITRPLSQVAVLPLPPSTTSSRPRRMLRTVDSFHRPEMAPRTELFFILEDIPSKDEDELCESIFVNSHIHNADGRYILKLPFRDDSSLPFRDDSSLGDSKEGALKRFYSLERKLHSNNQLKEQYLEFMEENQNLGHMTPLLSDVKSPHYFLPHHGVINDNSSTTKLRVVFDGSFKSTNGNSLNDILLTGKKLQSDIFLTSLKFRFFPIASSTDIAKMYRQILISHDDACFQQIFWRKSPEEPLGVFKLNTVTYGTSCAPFLAIRTLKQLCEDEKHRFPQAAKLAKDHFYVDNLLAGADSLDSAGKIFHELQNLMSAGGFELRKWSCTHPEVLSDLPNILKTNISSHSFDDESTQKILDLVWDLNEDSFKKAGLDRDDDISSDILNRWNRFQAEISCLKQIKVPRVGSWSKMASCDFYPSSNSFIPFSEQPVPLGPIDQSEALSDSVVLSTGVDYSLSFLDKFSSCMKELVLSLLRQQFWIPNGKSAVKKELRNYIDCFKHVAKPVSQMMGELPIERITPCRGFEKVVSSDEVEKDVLVSLAALLPQHLAVPNQMDAGPERPNGRIPRPHQESSLFQHQVDSRTDCGHTSWS